jgi:hypothetical protein
MAAAGLIAVLLTLAIATAFMALHLSATRTTPAEPSTTTLTGQLYDGSPRMMTPTTGWGFSRTGVIRTTDGGATWRSVGPAQLNVTTDVRAWYFFDADHAWIGLLSGTSLIVSATTDGGRTWTAGTPVPAGSNPAPNRALVAGPGNQLDFLDDRVGWLRTTSGDDRPTPQLPQHTFKLYGTTDGGRTWRLIAEAADSDGSTLGKLGRGCFADDLKFVSVNLGWIGYNCIYSRQGGQPGTGSPAPGPEVAVTKDGGRSWQQVLLPQFTTGQNLCFTLTPVFYKSSEQIWFASCYNSSQVSGGASAPDDWIWAAHTGIYLTSDGGLSWSLRPTPGQGQTTFSDAENGWSIAWSPHKGGTDVFRTFDGGHTWNLTGSLEGGSPTDGPILRVFDSNVAIVTITDTSGSLTNWSTTDGGRTWARVSDPSPSS